MCIIKAREHTQQKKEKEMSNKSELDLQSIILKYLKILERTNLGYFYKVKEANRIGVPDICGHYRGVPVYFELKKNKNSPTSRAQINTIMLCALSGAQSRIVTSLNEVKDTINHINQKREREDS